MSLVVGLSRAAHLLRVNTRPQAVAAGVRPQMERIGPDGTDVALRRVVLSVAQQQRLAVCSALLREVAASFGFALHVGPDIGDEDAGACAGKASCLCEMCTGSTACSTVCDK